MAELLEPPVELASHLNEACQCVWVDRATLQSQLRAGLGDVAAEFETRAGLVSGQVVFIGARGAAAMDRSIQLIIRALESEAFQAKAAAARGIARMGQPAPGGVLGFDFHLGGSTPQLIEINTNPGGLLVSLELAQAATASCDCLAAPLRTLAAASVDLDQLGLRVVAGFRDEWTRARGTTPLQTIAIVDDDPTGQYLYPEFLLYRRLLAGAGWRVLIVDPGALLATDEALWLHDQRIDLVYNRLTDFYFAEERHLALRRAYEQDLAVITPHPAAHARWADKRLLAWLCDEALLADAGLDAHDRAEVLQAIPPTEIVEPHAAASLWARRKSLFFKPVDGYASKAAYRGDKLTRTAFDHVLAHPYVAQAIAPTSFRRICVDEGKSTDLRVDVRNFVMHGETWLRSARLYRGQTTNFRTMGGGFAPVLTLPG